jgi:hypothetical protein
MLEWKSFEGSGRYKMSQASLRDFTLRVSFGDLDKTYTHYMIKYTGIPLFDYNLNNGMYGFIEGCDIQKGCELAEKLLLNYLLKHLNILITGKE